MREGPSSREKRCEFGDTLHDTPQNSSHNNIREQQTSRASFGVGSASSHEQTSADTTAETNHGNLVIAQASLQGRTTADIELELPLGI